METRIQAQSVVPPFCTSGQTLLSYEVGATATQGTTTAAAPTNALGTYNGTVSTLGANVSLTLNMGTVLPAGTIIKLYYSSIDVDAPIRILTSSVAAGPYTDIGEVLPSLTATTQSIPLLLPAQYIRLSTSLTSFKVDAVTYPLYVCAGSPVPVCASGQSLFSYGTGATAIEGASLATNPTNAVGPYNGSYAALAANEDIVLNMGAAIPAGTTLTLHYKSANVTAPLQVEVSTVAGGPYTNIEQVEPSTTKTTASIVLPLSAQYIRLAAKGTAFDIDALTVPNDVCASSPAPACAPGQSLLTYGTGATAIEGTSLATTPANAVGAYNGTYASLAANEDIVLDMGSTLPIGTNLTLYYKSLNVTAPLQVEVSTVAGGPYTNIAQVEPSTASTTSNIALPLGARYIRLAALATAFDIDALTAPNYVCAASPAPTCVSGESLLSYEAGATAVESSTSVTNPANVLGNFNTTEAVLAANGNIVLNMGTVLPVGTVLKMYYNSAATAPLQVQVGTAAAGPFTTIGQVVPSVSDMVANISIPISGQYIRLSTTAASFNIDALTYPNYVCAASVVPTCASGESLLSYEVGVTAVQSATNVTNQSNALGNSNTTVATLAINGVLTVDMGSTMPVGTAMKLYYRTGNATTPVQLSVSSVAGGPYTNIAEIAASTTLTNTIINLPLAAQYFRFTANGATVLIDALVYNNYACAAQAAPSCASGETLLTYETGATAIEGTTLAATPTNALGNYNVTYASLAVNENIVLNMGSVLPAATVLELYYKSAVTTDVPLQVEVATLAAGPYTSIAQIGKSATATSVLLTLPLSAQYIRLSAGSNAFDIDALVQFDYACSASLRPICASGEVLLSYEAGAIAIDGTSLAANPTNAVGNYNATYAALAANENIVLDMGSVLPIGTALKLYYKSLEITTAPLQVEVSAVSGGPFANILQVAQSATATSLDFTLPVAGRYIRFATSTNPFDIDALAYPIYDCSPSLVPTCAPGESFAFYGTGATAIEGTPTATNAANATGNYNGTYATAAANQTLTLNMGAPLAAGTLLKAYYKSANLTAPMKVEASVLAAGPYINIEQLVPHLTDTVVGFALPISAQYFRLTSAATSFSVDALMQTIYVCAPTTPVSCASGEALRNYEMGAVAIEGTTAATTPTKALGWYNGSYATLAANQNITLNMGTALDAGTSIRLYYKSDNVAAPLQVEIATAAGGPYSNIAQIVPSTTAAFVLVALPFAAQYIRLSTNATPFDIDALTYQQKTCVSVLSNTCGSNDLVTYPAGAVNIPAGQAGVGSTVKALGLSDASGASMSNTSFIVDMGESIAEGTTIRVKYKSVSGALPLEVFAAANLAGPYTYLGYALENLFFTDANYILPLDAQYIKLASVSIYVIDAVEFDKRVCVPTPVPMCSSTEQTVPYESGVASVVSFASATNSANITGGYNLTDATIASGGNMVVDMGTVVPAGSTLRIYNKMSGNAVLSVGTTATGPFIPIGSLPVGAGTAVTSVVNELVLPIDARYVRLQAFNADYLIDALVFDDYACVPRQDMGGVVYYDANNNGRQDAKERGIAGIRVNLYDANNVLVATTVTVYDYDPVTLAVTGSYSFTGVDPSGNYRIEFVNEYISTLESASAGTQNGTNIQFYGESGYTGNFGLYVPDKYCTSEEVARLLAGCGANGANPSVVDWIVDDHNSTGTGIPINHPLNANQVGVPLGVTSFARGTTFSEVEYYYLLSPLSSTGAEDVFPPPPDGRGTIYILDYSNANRTYQSHKILMNVEDLGIDLSAQHPLAGQPENEFGTHGLGNLSYSKTAEKVYTINMGQNTLLAIDISGVEYQSVPSTSPTLADIEQIPIPDPGCSNGYYRPSAVKVSGTDIFVGGICDASLGAADPDLTAVVQKYNTLTHTWTTVLTYNLFDINGWGTSAGGGGFVPNEWSYNGLRQPFFSDLEIADNGYLIMGFSDRSIATGRSGNQTGCTLMAALNPNGTYTFEENRTVGVQTRTNASLASDTGGPGGLNGYFLEQSYAADISPGHYRQFNGGLFVVPGTGSLVVGATDPTAFNSFGVAQVNWQNGQNEDRGVIFGSGKVSRLTGVDALACLPAPLEIGNRVWVDTDLDGIQDPGEAPIPGVTVELLNNSNVVIATAVTDANGNYIFSEDLLRSSSSSHQYGLIFTAGETYTVRIPNASGPSKQTALATYSLTSADMGSSNLIDSDGTMSGAAAIATVTIGARNDHSLDYGFTLCAADLMAQDANICGGASIDLSTLFTQDASVGTITYHANYPDALNGTGAIAPLVTPPATTEYFIRKEISAGCFDIDSVDITVSPLVVIASNSPVCDGQPINLMATFTPTGTSTSVTTWAWSGPNLFSSNLEDPTGFTATAAAAGTYTVVATDNNGCISTTTLEVLVPDCTAPCVNPPSVVLTEDNVNTCGTAAAVFQYTVANGPTTTFSHNGAGVLSLAQLPNGSATFTYTPAAGDAGNVITINAVIADPDGPALCMASSDVVTVTVQPLPSVSAASNSPVCNGDNILLTAQFVPNGSSTGAVSWSWAGPSFTANVEDPTAFVASPTSAGSYTVQVTDNNGCTNTATVTVAVPDCITDYGDLPAPYNTAGSGGPSHPVTAGLFIGTTVDIEGDGQPSATATGDGADEDGVVFPVFAAGQLANITVNVTNTTGNPAELTIFIDWDGDGAFTGPGEVITPVSIPDGTNNSAFVIPVTVPAGAILDTNTGARFRLSTETGLGPNGPAADGEVEDYLIQIPSISCIPPVLTIAPGSICAGNAIDIASLVTGNTPAGTLTFYATQADADAGTNALLNTTVAPAVTTTYYVRSEVDAACFSTAAIVITVNTGPVLTVSDGVVCSGGSIDLSTLANGTGGTITYHATYADAVAGTPTIPSVVSPASATNYYVRNASSATCYTVKELVVRIKAPTCGTIQVTGPGN